MSYALRDKNEVNRLDAQSQSAKFDISKELNFFSPKNNSSVLEIGCGAGNVISYLNGAYKIKASGCDLLEEHVQYCKENCSSQINFFQHDIRNTEIDEKKYDYIIMRYVAHHLGVRDFEKSIKNILKSLKPGGELIIIDVDGLMKNIGTENRLLKKYLSCYEEGYSGDFEMGRKIPKILSKENIREMEAFAEFVNFCTPQERAVEAEQWRQRLMNSKKVMAASFESELDYNKFVKLYVEEIQKTDTLFYFIKTTIRIKV
ncbi:MAG: hypothetical protein CME66_10240 [Halobacteriovoraceae bacterium]|jgi:SAM-dependent methyltransferase|nr:hypothetical protein [Halobacteriovoraceae bacterium]